MIDRNPYALLREKCGLSTRAFAEKSGLSRQTLVHIEAGTYPTLSDGMVLALGKLCFEKDVVAREVLSEAYGVDTLAEAYSLWRDEQRQLAAERVNSVRPNRSTAELSPMHFVVKDSIGSAQGFSKALKVPASLLMRYVTGAAVLMPRELETALRDLEYPFLLELQANQTKWRDERATVRDHAQTLRGAL
jgi:DNA-binding XRE family transcriptional regulator